MVDNIVRAISKSQLPYGGEIELTEPPTAINVVIRSSLDGKIPTMKRLQQLRMLQSVSISSVPGDIVVPIATDKSTETREGGSGNKFNSYKFRKRGLPWTTGTPIYAVRIRDIFPIEMAFAMTVHKAQGRTIDKVILAIDENPVQKFVFAAVFVAFSRVRHRDNLRLLNGSPDHRTSRMRRYGYLLTLFANSYISQYYHGFTGSPEQKWDAERTARAHFSTYNASS